MPHFAHKRIRESDTTPEFPPQESLQDDNSQLAEAIQDPVEREKLSSQLAKIKTADQRRTHFANKDARKYVTFGPNDLIATDFCYGFLEFSPELALRIPGGMSFNLTKYWDGQPVQFVCCKRRKLPNGEGPGDQEVDPWGEFFWCISIQLEQQDDTAETSGIREAEERPSNQDID